MIGNCRKKQLYGEHAHTSVFLSINIKKPQQNMMKGNIPHHRQIRQLFLLTVHA